MAPLLFGLVVFLGVHLIPAFPNMRAGLIAQLGETPYRIGFIVVSLISLGIVIAGYALAPVEPVWEPPVWARHLALVLMLPAFVCIAAAYIPGRIKATLKHPFLVGIKLWATAHLLANGDLASIILFGSFLAYAVADRILTKRRERLGLIETPAISGPPRNDLIAVAVGTAIYLVFLFGLHRLLFGVSPLPG
jgi:uncharacterized membrane protein